MKRGKHERLSRKVLEARIAELERSNRWLSQERWQLEERLEQINDNTRALAVLVELLGLPK